MAKIIVVSGPVIVKNNQVLLDISGDDDFWKFCGGKINEGENLREAAARRAKEELGIMIDIISDPPFLMYVKKPGEENIDVLLVHWLSEFNGEIKPDKNVKKWQWLDINDLPNIIAPNIIPALKHFGFLK